MSFGFCKVKYRTNKRYHTIKKETQHIFYIAKKEEEEICILYTRRV